jgi:hypothetical protein
MSKTSRLVLFAGAAVALAAPTLRAQAPRATVESKVGEAKVVIEHGCPPWSEQRRAQMDQMLPVGGYWRLGADTRTTLVVDGADVAIGDLVVERGGYGFNVRRAGEKEWTFALYDGSDTNPGPDDAIFETPVALTEKQDAAPDRLVISFPDGGKTLVVRFGPLELRAPVAAIQTRESELSIGGESATAKWFSRTAADAPRGWTRAGTIASFYVGDFDAAMDVDLKLDGGKALVRFTNRERAKLADKLARIERQLELAGQGARRFQAGKKQLEEQKASLTEELAKLAPVPAPVELEVALKPAAKKSGRSGAELVRRENKLAIAVDADALAGELAVDEKRILPAPAGN